MNTSDKLLRFIVLVLCSCAYNAAAEGWQKIEVPSTTMTVIDNNGQNRNIKPGCAFSYLPDEMGMPNQPFHFYFREGIRKDKTLIYFNGGGACWNSATCLTSLVVGERPVYNPDIEQENSPEIAGGIMDLTPGDNPVREWNIVFIPSCTGDAHLGSRDMQYRDANTGNQIVVQHRGFDNFMAVREWIRNSFNRKYYAKHVMIAGSSVGSYGALLHFPRLHSLFPPETKFSFLADAGAGIFTQGFIDLVFAPTDSPWGVEGTLTSVTPGIGQLNSFDAEVFYQEILTGMANHFHTSQFAHYTTAWDGVQVLFLNIMQQTDAGSINPDEWSKVSPAVWQEWHRKMRESLRTMALNKNIHYYIGAGMFHMGLVDMFKPIPGYFYQEHSAGNTFLADWVAHLNTNGRNQSLPSLICEGDCAPPSEAK
ncbi:hypothetical protein ABO04_10255 [Nitrosomonas sp. HPC101]|uniref:pectin acetylesterase-family hydrolase n=1 Tax=Nitrosomonas sp. HPC101 TaxID=1658667 RepID=UPI001367DBF7|nr:pectin acetylesterase-family hydrolase [Nitrosomonas sp. HPC101]MXS86269.1 hypothetical protein [Nitrosomonas sp. HPC101]